MSVTVPAPRRPRSSSPSRAVTPPTVSTAEGRGSGERVPGEAVRSWHWSLPSDSGCVAHSSPSPVPSVSPPIRIESSSPTVVEGQTLDLNCLVTGQPQATITWYKRGGSLPARHQVWSGARPWGGQLEDRRQDKRPEVLAAGPSSCWGKTEGGLSRSDGGGLSQPVTPQPLNPLHLCTPRPMAPA